MKLIEKIKAWFKKPEVSLPVEEIKVVETIPCEDLIKEEPITKEKPAKKKRPYKKRKPLTDEEKTAIATKRAKKK